MHHDQDAVSSPRSCFTTKVPDFFFTRDFNMFRTRQLGLLPGHDIISFSSNRTNSLASDGSSKNYIKIPISKNWPKNIAHIYLFLSNVINYRSFLVKFTFCCPYNIQIALPPLWPIVWIFSKTASLETSLNWHSLLLIDLLFNIC